MTRCRYDSMDDSGIYRMSPVTLTSLSPTPSLLSTVAVEPIKIELPPLGAEFRGRDDFLDNIITTLNELQKVCGTGSSRLHALNQPYVDLWCKGSHVA